MCAGGGVGMNPAEQQLMGQHPPAYGPSGPLPGMGGAQQPPAMGLPQGQMPNQMMQQLIGSGLGGQMPNYNQMGPPQLPGLLGAGGGQPGMGMGGQGPSTLPPPQYRGQMPMQPNGPQRGFQRGGRG